MKTLLKDLFHQKSIQPSRNFPIIILLLVVVAIAGVADTATALNNHPFHAGDAVKVTVFPDTAAMPNGVYLIDHFGAIRLPLEGVVFIGSMTEKDLAELIKLRYVDFQKVPNASVRPLIRLSATGGFHNPGLYYVDPNISIWDAVRVAGGPVRDDGLGRIEWHRGRRVMATTLIDQIAGGKTLREVGFQSGDHLQTTDRPHRSAGDIMVSVVLPILSFTVTAAFSSLTIWQLSR